MFGNKLLLRDRDQEGDRNMQWVVPDCIALGDETARYSFPDGGYTIQLLTMGEERLFNGRWLEHYKEYYKRLKLGQTRSTIVAEQQRQGTEDSVSRLVPPKHTVLAIYVSDNGREQNMLEQHLKRMLAFIKEANAKGAPLLFHCHQGISRSPTALIAVLYATQMLAEGHNVRTMWQCYEHVRRARPQISPSMAFLGELIQLENVLNLNGEASNEFFYRSIGHPVPGREDELLENDVLCRTFSTNADHTQREHVPLQRQDGVLDFYDF